MRQTLGAIALLLVGTLAACSGSDDSPSDDAPAASLSCRLLDAADREALAGVEVDEEAPVGSKTVGEQCHWNASKARAFIETTTAESSEWVSSVPALFDQLEGSGLPISADDKREFAEMRKILADGADLSASKACEMFTTLSEIGGAPEGAEFVINYVPLTAEQLSITAQTCTDGRFTSVLFVEDGLEESATLEEAVKTALDTAHERALSTP